MGVIDWRLLGSRGWLTVMYPSDRELLALGRDLGTPRSVRPSGPLVDRLIPRNADEAPERSLSAFYGFGAFPLHTDAAHHQSPPRLVLLRLAGGAQSASATLLLDLRAALADLD